jgi:acyl carrier protein
MSRPSPQFHERIASVVARVGQTRVPPEPHDELVADLGFDSMRLLELIAELEDEFGIYIPLNQVPAIKTVEQVGEKVSVLLQEQKRA